jgi:hypothetical protein
MGITSMYLGTWVKEGQIIFFQGLECYIQTLPSEDEHDTLRKRLRAKEDECGRLHMRVSAVTIEMEKVAKESRALKEGRDSSDGEVISDILVKIIFK